MFVFDLHVSRYALEASLDIKENTVATTLKICGTMTVFLWTGLWKCRAGLGFSRGKEMKEKIQGGG